MNPNQPEPPPLVDGSFMRTLQSYRKGEILSELSAALRRVTEAVSNTKKPGSITLTVKITPAGEVYAFMPEVTVKLPREPKLSAMFYLDYQFNLVREDPNQRVLPLRTLDGGAQEGMNGLVDKGIDETSTNPSIQQSSPPLVKVL